jgi:hypothetical protein
MSKIKSMYTYILALLPLLANYKLFALDSNRMITIGLFLIIILIPLEFGFAISKPKRIKLNLLFIIFCIYFLFRADFTVYYIAYVTSFFWGICGGLSNLLDREKHRKIIIYVSLFAACSVILQTIVHKLAGIHIPMNIPGLISSEEYQSLILTAMDSTTQLYRPSAFFLEPAHFCQYTVVGLVLLIDHEKQYKYFFIYEIIISIGMILTTSGMGIVLMLGAWGWKFLKQCSLSKIAMQRTLIGIMAAMLTILIASDFPIVQKIWSRINGSSGYNAIGGRIFAAYWLFPTMTERQWLMGVGYSNRPDYYMTGFIQFIYCLGIIGLTLFITSFFYGYFRKTQDAKIITIVYIALMFISSNVSSISIMWWATICMEIDNHKKSLVRFKWG